VSELGQESGAAAWWPRLARALPWGLLVLFLVRGGLALWADGTTPDEPLHLWYGERALVSGTFLRGSEELNSKMPVSALNALPVEIALHLHPEAVGASWPRQLHLARWPSLLLGALLCLLVWRWAAALFGRGGGALALFLCSFCPNLLAHAHLVTTDVSTCLGIFAATYCLWRYLAAPSRRRLLVLAAAFGLAQLAKATALFLAPIFVAILAVRAVRAAAAARRLHGPGGRETWRSLARELRRGAALMLWLAVAAIVALNAGFLGEGSLTPLKRYHLVSRPMQTLAAQPWLRDLPVPLPYAYVEGLDMVARDAGAPWWSYLRGRYSQQGFRSYFLVGLLVKVPVAAQLLVLLALGLWLAGRARAAGADECLLLPVALLLLYFSLWFRLELGLRYVLPVLPFLFVFAGRLAAPGVVRGLTRGPWRTAIAGGLLLWAAAASLSIHPHYLAYFNEIAGGPAQGGRWLLDSNLDWNQDADRAKALYQRAGEPLSVNPGGPVAGRIVLGISDLIGRDPESAARHAWLRDHFKPIATVGWSQAVYDVSEDEIERCCAAQARTWFLTAADDLALRGRPFAGGEGVTARFAERLNDGSLGANQPIDACRTTPPQPRAVRAWFGVAWSTPQSVGRVLAFPGFYSRGPQVRRFLALDYVLQSWDGAAWRDLPGTRTRGNDRPHVEHRFAPVRTTAVRLLVERERNDQGTAGPGGGFRAACLELAVFPW
jgi:hypothetical protein